MVKYNYYILGGMTMSQIDVELITEPTAKEFLTDYKEQKRNNNVPELKSQGHFILPDYKLTRQRKAFKIMKHTYLTKHYKSYVAFDSDNGHTLWMKNFASLTEAVFWLETGLEIGDTDTRSTYKDWKIKHDDKIQSLKDQLRLLKKKHASKQVPLDNAN